MRRTNADLVIGSRYIPGGGTRNWPWFRRAMSRFACLIARPLTPVADVTSGLFLIRRDVARDVRISAGGFKICLELLVRGRAESIVEVPYVFSDRAAGESKMNTKEALGYLTQLRALHRFQRSQPPLRRTYRRIAPEDFTSSFDASGLSAGAAALVSTTRAPNTVRDKHLPDDRLLGHRQLRRRRRRGASCRPAAGRSAAWRG